MKINLFFILFIAVILLITSIQAKEPHSSKDHNYKESAIYKNDSILTIGQAVKKAIQSSPRLYSSQARLRAAIGLERQASYFPNPKLQLEVENIAGSGQYENSNSAEYTYAISQTIEVGGKRSARKNVANAISKTANIMLIIQQLDITRDVNIAYTQILAAAEALKLAKEQEQLAKEILASVSKRVNAAREPEIQKSKAELLHATSLISLQQKEYQLALVKEKLARLWGESSLNFALDHSYFFKLNAPKSLENYRNNLSQTPDMKRFTYMRKEKKSAIDLERAKAISDPNIQFGVREFRNSNNQAFVIGLSLPIPLINRNQGNIAYAGAELSRINSDEKQAKLMLDQQLTQNWQNWQTAYLEIKKLKEYILPTAKKSFKLAREGYQKGKFPYLEVLDSQRTLFDSWAQYNNALKRYHSSKANVQRLTTTIN